MSKSLAAAVLLATALSVARGADKLATVDLEAVIRSHPKTEGNRQTLRNTQKEFEGQRDALTVKIEKLRENFVKATEQANNTALNETARETQRGIAREILTELRQEEEGLRRLVSRLQRSLNETEILLFEGTMKDVNAMLEALVKEKGVTLVIDKSAIRTGAPVPIVLWASPTLDITDELIKRIGGTRQPESED